MSCCFGCGVCCLFKVWVVGFVVLLLCCLVCVGLFWWVWVDCFLIHVLFVVLLHCCLIDCLLCCVIGLVVIV